jgi:hypothetical protein
MLSEKNEKKKKNKTLQKVLKAAQIIIKIQRMRIKID